MRIDYGPPTRLHLQQQRHGPVVDELDLHASAEHAAT
jgi:hypothetical protein